MSEKNVSVIEKLRDFEKQQEDLLEKSKAKSLASIEKSKKDAESSFDNEKEKLMAEKENKVAESKENAKKDSKKLQEEYNKKKQQLDKLYSKNSAKAVDKVFSVLLGK